MTSLALYPIPSTASSPWVLDCDHPPSSGVWVVGRAPLGQIRLTNARVSKHHAELRAVAVDEICLWEVQDTNSTNGTYLNNKLLYPRVWTELTEHDILRFGDLVFEVSFDVNDTAINEPTGTQLVVQPCKAEPETSTIVEHRLAQPWWAEWVEAVWGWWTRQNPFMQWIMLVTTGVLAALLLWIWKL